MTKGLSLEPSFENLFFYENQDITRGLNYYSTHASDDQVKEWSHLWCIENDISTAGLRSYKPGQLISHACFYRMVQRGFPMDNDLRQRINAFFRSLKVEKEPQEQKPIKKVETVQPVECLQNLDAYFDEVITGGITSTRAPSLCKTAKDVRLVEAKCNSLLEELREAKDGYDKETHKLLSAACKSILKSLEVQLDKIKTEKTKAVRKTNKSPAVVAKDVRFKKSEGKLASILPPSLVGAKKAYVYDVEDRKLTVFHATEAGFTFTGTTLKNIDLVKTKKKTIRKPETVLELKDVTMSSLNKLFASINAKEQDTTGRFNEHMLILGVS